MSSSRKVRNQPVAECVQCLPPSPTPQDLVKEVNEAGTDDQDTSVGSSAGFSDDEGHDDGHDEPALDVQDRPSLEGCRAARTKLSSTAKSFSPARDGGQATVVAAVEKSLGDLLAGVRLCQTMNGWEVHLDITASCAALSRQDAQNVALASVVNALQAYSESTVSLEFSPDGTAILFKYLPASPVGYCWDFIRFGSCPRCACKWPHVRPTAYTFKLNIIGAPVVELPTFQPMPVCAFQPTPVLVMAVPAPVPPAPVPATGAPQGPLHLEQIRDHVADWSHFVEGDTVILTPRSDL